MFAPTRMGWGQLNPLSVAYGGTRFWTKWGLSMASFKWIESIEGLCSFGLMGQIW